MHISQVTIRNYRNFTNAVFKFNEGVNTIIGENASGKTNFFRAIRLIMDDQLYRFAYKISESDFNRSMQNWKGHWIIISIEFEELSADEVIQSLFIHSAGKLEKVDIVERATYTLLFRPNLDIRTKLSELKPADVGALNTLLDTVTIDDYETIFTGKSEADFSNDEIYKSLVGDFEKVIFPKYLDDKLCGLKIPNQLSITKEVSFTYIQALRDVIAEFNSNRTNPLLHLMKQISDEIPEEDVSTIIDQVKELNIEIEKLDGVQQVRKDISDTMTETVGNTYSPETISIKSNVPEDPEKMLQSLRLLIGEDNDGYEGSIYELSLGGANLIYLTLKILEYKYRKDKLTLANFLIIEEPEAHIHNHIQKTLFEKIDFEGTQIIYSTHSTQISEVSKISSVNVLSKEENTVGVYQPSTGLNDNEILKLERFLDAIRTNLLFAKGVILVEGDAEEIVLPQILKLFFGLSVDELGISIVNIRGIGFENISTIFHEDRIHKKCAILTDLDEELNGQDTKASKLGKARVDKLNALCKDNEYLEIHHAKHTFEVDYLLSHNSSTLVGLVPKIYTDPKTIKKAIPELKSKDPKISGKRVLTMANNKGKGWFALELSSHITPFSEVPEYILKAACFAMSSSIKKNIQSIFEYRVFEILKRTGGKLPKAVRLELNKFYKDNTTTENLSFQNLTKTMEWLETDQLITLKGLFND